MFTLFQQHSTDDYRGRIFGALASVEGVCQLAATFAAGYLGQAVGIIPVITVQGVCYVVAGFTVLFAVSDAATYPPREAIATSEITEAMHEGAGPACRMGRRRAIPAEHRRVINQGAGCPRPG
ncbi:hypothetical protein ABH926_005294 [Catenulispora sp. GP43]|uniref:hypothetical protein n=1 Tax=Catenulispora sp. GP43 TaxID=3156263 RepID=UPI0035137227